MWISAKFTLLVIRTFDAIATGQTLQQQFLIADKEFKTATEIASQAGYTLNHVGKKVKPIKKRIRDNLLEKLQIALPFFESKAVDIRQLLNSMRFAILISLIFNFRSLV